MASRLRQLELDDAQGSAADLGPGDIGPADSDAADEEIRSLRAAIRAHPCHSCPDREEHARWAERYFRITRENDTLRNRIEGRTGSLGRTFDAICSLLDARGFLAGDETTPPGRQLARIWSESDLLTAECLRAGSWDRLSPAELAAVASAVVYEPRREERPVDLMPTEPIRQALAETARVWARLADDESDLRLPRTRQPEPGFAWAAYRWANGQSLDKVLTAAERNGTDLTAGDFVRWCKQILDLLEQLAAVPAPTGPSTPVSATARAAATAVRRGVVAQSMQL
jgi:ATP-dependent RNA helicase HelY